MLIFEGKMRKPPQGEIVVVVSKFNQSITDRLLDGALAKLRECQVEDQSITVVRVPGAFEMPLVAARYADMQNVLSVICLGAVIKGETSHDEHINRAVSLELVRTGSETGTPVIFGLLTCNTIEQAIARSGGAAQSHDKAVGKDVYIGNKGYEAAEAALEMINLLEQLPAPSNPSMGALSNIFAQAMMNGSDPGDIYDSPFDFYDDDDWDDDDDDWDDDDDDDFFEVVPRKKAPKRAVKKVNKKASGKKPPQKHGNKPPKKGGKRRKGH